MIYLVLFLQMANIGLFSIGGGYATIPFFQELANTAGWYSNEQLTDIIALASCVPGAVGGNIASCVGLLTAGPLGVAFCIAGFIFHAIVVILIIAKLKNRFDTSKVWNALMSGLRPASVALLIFAAWTIIQLAVFNAEEFAALTRGEFPELLSLIKLGPIILLLVVLVLSNIKPFKKLHPAVWIFGCAVVGIIFSF